MKYLAILELIVGAAGFFIYIFHPISGSLIVKFMISVGFGITYGKALGSWIDDIKK